MDDDLAFAVVQLTFDEWKTARRALARYAADEDVAQSNRIDAQRLYERI